MSTVKITSAEANKYLKQLQEKKALLVKDSAKKSSFVAAIEENVENVRPEYSFEDREREIAETDYKIVQLKHAINVFNTTHIVNAAGAEHTIDQVLVLMPMLNERKKRYATMAGAMQKERVEAGYGRTSQHIEYKYANYDIEDAKTKYQRISDLINACQLALDKVNTTEAMEVEASILEL